MEIQTKLINIINTENKKDPLTDVQIAKFLNTTRENITNIRKELNISNSRQRRYPYLKSAILAIKKNAKILNISDITRELLEQGFNISRRVVEEVLSKEDDCIENIEKRTEERDPFAALIGHHGSLKNAIEQAKSAIMYPPKGLPTLIVGESGVGKSLFSKKMYDFAKQEGVLYENSSFVVFNCADYADNPQLLLSLLFGYKKGAFTGAVNDSPGLVEEADGGMLFLDEIHRLPPKGQEILFSILDRGCFRRLGETNIERKVSVMLVGATTENIETNLLLTFRRRIPMVIYLPSLRDRFLKEKVDLICRIFQQECNRINSKIFVDKNVVEILALNKFSGNIGQLQNMIQVLCARSFMQVMNKKEDRLVSIDVNEILKLMDSFNETNLVEGNYSEIRKYLNNLMLIPFKLNDSAIDAGADREDVVVDDIYRSIEEKYYDLKLLNLTDGETENILWAFILNRFTNLKINEYKQQDVFSMHDLYSFVSQNITNAVKELMNQMMDKESIGQINKNAFKYLAIHLDEAIKRIKLNQKIININIEKIKKEFSKEYAIGLEFANKIEASEGVKIPDDEVGFITLYLKSAFNHDVLKPRVGLIMISHGYIATETVKVIKELLGTNFPIAIDMPLNEKPINIYNKAIELAKVIDQGRGVLFLVDMGSLSNIGDIVYNQTNIKAKTLERVDIVLGLEATRRVSLGEDTLEEIYFYLKKDKFEYLYVNEKENNHKPNLIVTVCLTGEGNAKHISRLIQNKYEDLPCYSMSAMDEFLVSKIMELQKENNVLVVGTINPKIPGTYFIDYDENLLKNIDIHLATKNELQRIEHHRMIDRDLMIFEPEIYFKSDLLEYICSLLINKGYVEKEYLQSVLDREALLPTFTEGNTAVPHGNSIGVNRTSFVFVKLKNPINWGVGNVNFVFMPVFKSTDKENVKDMLKILRDHEFMTKIKSCVDKETFQTIILDKIDHMQ